jgi:hypothetical protein
VTRATRIAVSLAVLAAPLAACGGGSNDGSSSPVGPAGPATGAPTSTSTSQPGPTPGPDGGTTTHPDGGGKPSASGGTPRWTAHLGGPQADVGYALAADKNGEVVVVGYFAGTANLGGVSFTSSGQVDFFVAKYGADGAAHWVRPFGGSGNDVATSVSLDASGNVFVAGTSDGALTLGGSSFGQGGATGTFLLGLDALGNVTLAKAFGGDSFGTLVEVAVAPDGTLGLAGSYTGQIDLGGGPLTASAGAHAGFIAELDASGNLNFANPLGPETTTLAQGIGFSPTGTVAVIGSFSGTGQFGGKTLTSLGGTDVFAATFDSGGNPLWTKSWGSIENDDGRAVAFDTASDLILSGGFSDSIDFGGGVVTSAGGVDAFVMKLDPKQALSWVKTCGSTGTDESVSIAVDKSGAVLAGGLFEQSIMIGSTSLASAGDKDIFAAKFATDGSSIWAKSFGGVQADQGVGVSFDQSSNALVTGFFRTNVDFGTGMQSSAGDDDVFVASYGP